MTIQVPRPELVGGLHHRGVRRRLRVRRFDEEVASGFEPAHQPSQSGARVAQVFEHLEDRDQVDVLRREGGGVERTWAQIDAELGAWVESSVRRIVLHLPATCTHLHDGQIIARQLGAAPA